MPNSDGTLTNSESFILHKFRAGDSVKFRKGAEKPLHFMEDGEGAGDFESLPHPGFFNEIFIIKKLLNWHCIELTHPKYGNLGEFGMSYIVPVSRIQISPNLDREEII